MTVEFPSVSTASLGAMLKGYGVMAGVGAAWPDARFWWTPAGALTTDIPSLGDAGSEAQREEVRNALALLLDWANQTGQAFAKADGNNPPLKDPSVWSGLDPSVAADAEAVGVCFGRGHPEPNPVLGSWGQAVGGRANQFNTLRETAKAAGKAPKSDIDCAVFDEECVPKGRLRRGGGLLFPEGIKRYAAGVGPGNWIHETKKPLGNWDYILAVRGLLLLRGAARSPRGSRRSYPAFPFVLPGSAIRAQGSTVTTQEVFLPTWSNDRPRTLAEFRITADHATRVAIRSNDRPRTLAEFQAQVRSFQARVGRRDFASGAADFRRAIAGRAVTGAFDAFHRFALEPRKPGQRSPQNQAISRGVTKVGPVTAAHNSLRLLLAPLDDSGWIEKFRLRRTAGGKADESSARLALAKTRFDEAVHAAIDARGQPGDMSHVAVLKALWDLQFKLWQVSERPECRVAFRPAPLLEGRAWGIVLSERLENSPAARLGWALASLGWVPVTDDSGQRIRRPVVEQLLPVTSDDRRGLRVPDPLPRQRVPQPGHDPARELAALFWRRWLDMTSLPVLPVNGTRPADAIDVNGLLRGDVSVKDLQRYFLAFLLLDGSGEAPPPAFERRPVAPAYAPLRLWFDLSSRPTPGERRPMDGAVPRGVATGTAGSVASACRAALRRLRMAGLPGDWPDGNRPSGKSVARPEVDLSSQQARLMAAALLVPVSEESVARLANTLFVPTATTLEPKHRFTMETAHV